MKRAMMRRNNAMAGVGDGNRLAITNDDTSSNIVRETPSHADAKIGSDTDKVISEGDTEILNFGEEQGDDVDNQVNLEETTTKLDEGQDRSDPSKTAESRPPPEQVLIEEDQAGPDPRQSHEALAGPNPEPMHDDFVTTVYSQVHENLKHTTKEHVQMDNPLSSTGTLSSMKNLDNFTFGDQFIADKSPEDESGNDNVDTEVESMVTIAIHQASSSVPLLSTPVIDLSPSKPVSTPTVFTATTITTTTSLPLPPPPQQQSITDSELTARVTALEKIFSGFEQKSKTLDNTTQNLRSREAVHVAFQAPLRDRFRELPEADMKEIIHQRMFESGSYIIHPEHVALYEALEVSIERANRDEFLAENDKSCKRHRDD
ncbi:hypothetical protein Tco_0646592 [Tanacetum coccineum]